MARHLVVTHLTAESPSLRDQVTEVLYREASPTFGILVPTNLPSWSVHLLCGVEDHPIRVARERARRARRRLEATGAVVDSVTISFRDPFDAVEFELESGTYSAVIVCTLPHPVSHWLRMDLPGRISRRFPALAVTHVVAPIDFHLDQIGA
jgi:hypothetical protein